MSVSRPNPPRASDRILSTKLMAPRLSGGLVERAALLAHLDEGLNRKLILVTGPTGFGKTTLVSQWIHTRSFPSAWVTLDPADDDPQRFWDYVVSALRALDPSLGRAALSALRSAQSPASPMALLVPLINELAGLPDPCVLVLEDYHAIASQAVNETVAFLINHLPDNLHLAIISRSLPGLPLAILRARNQLVEIGVEDLRFSLPETQAFLSAAGKGSAPRQVAELLEQRTEGWVAGLRLASIALQGQLTSASAERWIAALSGNHPFISEYLTGEVFASQPETTQTFLLQTSILSRLCGPLCDALTGWADGEQTLAALERANLFLTQLETDDGQAWYRYHPLFAEAVQQVARQRLGSPAIAALQEKASRWYAEHGMLEEAIAAAVRASAYSQAAGLIEGYLDRSGLHAALMLRHWVEAIPVSELASHPDVCFNYAQALLYTSDRFSPATVTLIEPWLQMAEHFWQAEGNRTKLGESLTFRGLVAWFHGDFLGAFDDCRRALQILPEEDIAWRGPALLSTVFEDIFAGRTVSAFECILEARALLAASQNDPGTMAAILIMAEIYFLRGELEQAALLSRQVLAEAQGGDEVLDDKADAWICLARVAYERGDLDEAEQNARLALDAAEYRTNEWSLAPAAVALARVHAARGNPVQAQAVLRSATPRLKHASFLWDVQTAQTELALAAGQVALAQEWAAARQGSSETLTRMQQERESLLLARLCLAQDQPREALAYLAGWREETSANERVISEVEILCLEALAYDAAGEAQRAAQALTRALTLGEAKGFRRSFLDLGEPLFKAIKALIPALKRRPLAAYAISLLPGTGIAGRAQTAPPASGAALVEPLSAQEQRVLKLLAAGLSNPEIARELVVSTNTIKTQVKSIFRKLDVNTRQDARDTAQELGLL